MATYVASRVFTCNTGGMPMAIIVFLEILCFFFLKANVTRARPSRLARLRVTKPKATFLASIFLRLLLLFRHGGIAFLSTESATRVPAIITPPFSVNLCLISECEICKGPFKAALVTCRSEIPFISMNALRERVHVFAIWTRCWLAILRLRGVPRCALDCSWCLR